ncbi:MAG TPA: hypothetical protein VH328_09715, partial [Burkholderiaceae bacterium]|nr:hypothetical protein [Burkholderiaceae bacterium]
MNSPAPTRRLPRPSPRARRWIVRAFAAFVLLAIVAWAAVPIAVRRIGESQATQALGRPVHLASVSFNPLTLRLDVEGVTVAGAGAGAPDAMAV